MYIVRIGSTVIDRPPNLEKASDFDAICDVLHSDNTAQMITEPLGSES